MVSGKTNSKLGFIKRNINISSRTIKEQAYKTLVRPVLEYSQTVWDPCTVTGIKQLESVQWRAARFTLSWYHRTSSVRAMLNELNWQLLASRRRAARLVTFYKIHHKPVEVNMPLNRKLHVRPTHNENSMACHIPTTSADYQKNFSSIVQCRFGIVCLRTLFINPWILQGSYLSMKYLYSPVLHLYWWNPSVRSEGYADSRCGIVTVGLTRSTLHTVNYPTWSGVFNKFDHLLKKKSS